MRYRSALEAAPSTPARRRSDTSTLTARSTVFAAWTVAVATFATSLITVVEDPQGYDTVPLTNAAHAFVSGTAVYTGKGAGDFLYPPSALVLLSPLAAVDHIWANRLFLLVDTAVVLAATALLLRLFDFRWRGMAGAIALLGISIAWPVVFTLDAGNVNGPILLGLAGFLLGVCRGRWLLAAASLGATFVLKPILAPLLLLLVLYRKWGALALAVAIPTALSGLVLAAAPSTRSFFDITLPLLFQGQNADIQQASVALHSAAERLSVPSPAVALAEVAVGIATLFLIWRRWSADRAEPRRLVELTTIALVGAFLLSSFTFRHYGIFLLPFAVSVAVPSSPHRHWLTAAALFGVAAQRGWTIEQLPDRLNELLAERFTFALVLLLIALGLGIRRETAPHDLPAPRAALEGGSNPDYARLSSHDADAEPGEEIS